MADASVAAVETGPHWTRQARDIVDDLQQRSALIYWTDFLASVGAAWALAFCFFLTPGWGAIAVLSLLASAILFFRRALSFTRSSTFAPGNWRGSRGRGIC